VRRTLLAAALALALAAAPAGAVTQRTTLAAIEAQVMCVTCKIPLAEAESAQADQEKAFIQQLVNEGDTAAEIKHKLVLQYTSAVLAMPAASGVGIAVYVVPIAVVAALVALVALLLPRWRRNRRVQPAEPAVSITAAETARLDADLARFDR